MKKWLILLVILLTGCSSKVEEARVVIDLETINGLYLYEDIYVPVKELKKLDIEVKQNEHTAYLSTDVQKETVSNDKPFSWYVDQGGTGEHSGDNCGPASVVMAAKWQDENFTGTPEEARELYRSHGGWWYTDDIEDYFIEHDVDFELADYEGLYDLVETIDEGHIALLCLDTTYIAKQNDDDSYIGRFYSYEGGHFLIAKGYQYLDGVLYFEVYDSNNWGSSYSDGSPKGKDRLYDGFELHEAIVEWWDHYFIILD